MPILRASYSGNLPIQSDWVSFLRNGGEQQAVQVNFPKKFKEVYVVIPTLIDIQETPNIPSFRPKIGAGTKYWVRDRYQTGTSLLCYLWRRSSRHKLIVVWMLRLILNVIETINWLDLHAWIVDIAIIGANCFTVRLAGEAAHLKTKSLKTRCA